MSEKLPPVVSPVRPRLQIDFSPEAVKRVVALRERVHAKSNAEVVRDALRLYEWFLDQQQEGLRIQLVNKDNVVKEVVLLIGD